MEETSKAKFKENQGLAPGALERVVWAQLLRKGCRLLEVQPPYPQLGWWPSGLLADRGVDPGKPSSCSRSPEDLWKCLFPVVNNPLPM